ncbi:heme peroxidase [Infundibulicybe gibba]|nr:heme peroxidase [Infundibulicybe gibba]
MSLTRLPSVFRRQSTIPNGTAVGTSSTEAGPSRDQTGAAKFLKDLRDQIKRGLPVSLDASAIGAVIDAVRHTESIDDRKLLLEYALTFVSRLDDGPFAAGLQDKIVQLLYNDLGHPPATRIGNKHAWRTADGSYNNIDIPDLGKAKTPYARSVQQSHPLPKNQLPDPGLVFDTLLKREGFVKHPAGLSSMMFSFAALVIHSVFRTSHSDVNINETSSYVDLSPLYGHNQEAQDTVRIRDGRGLLFPDVFAEDRLLLLPPAVCALLVLFSRNHNYIARKLLEVNERGTYVDPDTVSPDVPTAKAKLLAQEEELFQIARMVNCGWFASVVFSDYFSCILGLVRDGSSWSLNPFEEMRMEDHSVFERGKGNVCSVEFNCLYRWHATTSVEDEQWVEQVFSQIFDGKSPNEVTSDDFKSAARKVQAMQSKITRWTFGHLQRQEDGTFKDEDLANILHNATEHPAGAFRARGTPADAYNWCKYLGLKLNTITAYASFLEWNPDPEIADAAEKLYGDIDHLELYVGLQAEEAKPVVEGAGLCPGYTISRAILSDAIALTRGDSTYTFFPLMTPDSMKTNLKKLDLIHEYDMARPKTQSPVRVVDNYDQVVEILKDKDTFVSPYAHGLLGYQGQRVPQLLHREGPEAREQIIGALLDAPDAADKIGHSSMRPHANRSPLIRSPWLGAGITLKTKETPMAPIPLPSTHILGDIYSFIFLEVETSKVMVLQKKLSIAGFINNVSSMFSKPKRAEQHALVKRLYEIGHSTDQLANTVLALLVGTTVELSLALTNMVTCTSALTMTPTSALWLLAVTSKMDWTVISARLGDSNHLSKGFILTTAMPGVAAKDNLALKVKKGDRVFLDTAAANRSATVFSSPSSVDASRNFKGFISGMVFSSKCGNGYCPLLTNTPQLSRGDLTLKIMSEVLHALFEIDGVQRAPGQSGALKRFKDDTRPELRFAYLDKTQFSSAWPDSMAILYNAA